MKSVFSIFKNGLQKTKTSLIRNIQGIFTGNKAWSEDDYDALEAALISSDLGVEVSMNIVDDIRDRYSFGEIQTAEDIIAIAEADVLKRMGHKEDEGYQLPDERTVILLVGVNGSGKTTSAAKLAHQFMQDGKSVMLAAADTFRAAGVEQMKIWAERLGCPVVGGKTGGDAAAVAFDAAQAFKKRDTDVLIIDTAGRQHTRKGLMDELLKVKRTINKAYPGAPHEVWLTVDASIGTNALIQAREFGKHCEVTGLILTKLDGSGKGGVVVAIREELGYPVRFIGLGEQLGDLQPFDPTMFAKALFVQNNGE